jgi:hypothetical protein
VHSTHAVPLHCDVVPLQTAQLGPQCAAVLQASHRFPLHHSPLGQFALVVHSTHAPPLQPFGQVVIAGE